MCLCLGTRRGGCDGFQCMNPEEPGAMTRHEELLWWAKVGQRADEIRAELARKEKEAAAKAASAQSVIWSFT